MHFTSQLNTGRLTPSYIKEYSLITNKLNGFSINYYGAESNKKTDFLSLVPRFELLLNFKNAVTVDSLVKLITPHIPKEAIISPGIVELLKNDEINVDVVNVFIVDILSDILYFI